MANNDSMPPNDRKFSTMKTKCMVELCSRVTCSLSTDTAANSETARIEQLHLILVINEISTTFSKQLLMGKKDVA